ncbi:MAG: ABC transporter permease [Clostridiales Family XIII bacterium]|jgi:ribose transport system permease protein|nr:ABC transporter permease [Clostridiales Family XIII bacterium]
MKSGHNKINARSILQNNNVVMLIVVVAIIILFTLLNSNYFSFNNMMNILYAASIIGLLSIGMTYLMIAGHIDLSCGAIAGMSGAICAVILRDTPIEHWPVAFVITLCVALAVGALNAVLVNVFELQPFIATLATASVCTGTSYLLSGGRAVVVENLALIAVGKGKLFGMPYTVVIMIILFIIFGFILSRTVFGRSVYMVGGNETAAKLAGLKPKKLTSICYLMSAGIASLAGVLVTARMHSAMPGAVSGSEFDAITAAVLGGVAFIGGRGNLAGCFIGLLIIQCFANGLTVLGINSFWQVVAKGILLIAALIFDYVRRKNIQPSVITDAEITAAVANNQ